MAVMQHHDAVTGTAKQHVTDDYSLRLWEGMLSCQAGMREALSILLPSTSPSSFHFCSNLNTSSCPPSETSSNFTISLYNPLGRDLENAYFRVPLSHPDYRITGAGGVALDSQLIEIPRAVQSIPGRESAARYELIWNIPLLRALSFTNFRIAADAEAANVNLRGPGSAPKKYKKDFWIDNGKISLQFGGLSGLLQKIKVGSVEVELAQNFYYYEGMKGNNSKFEDRASGAYIFRPQDHQPHKVTERVFSYSVHQGPLVTEVHQVFTEWISQVIRLYRGKDTVEFEWLVGPIPIDDSTGKEVITRYTSNLASNSTFYTDSNGRELLRRTRNSRPTWPYTVHEPVAGNYYPVNKLILSESPSPPFLLPTLILLNDRAEGGSSLRDGELELMLHRRLLFDDAFGVGEPLNETQYGVGLVARGKHVLLLCGGGHTALPPCSPTHRDLAQEMYLEKTAAVYGGDLGDLETRETLFTRLSTALPKGLHLLSLEALEEGASSYIMRLENYIESGEGGGEVRVSWEHLLSLLPPHTSIRESNLGGNVWKDEEARMLWEPLDGDKMAGNEGVKEEDSNDGELVLGPMEIKTFIIML